MELAAQVQNRDGGGQFTGLGDNVSIGIDASRDISPPLEAAGKGADTPPTAACQALMIRRIRLVSWVHIPS